MKKYALNREYVKIFRTVTAGEANIYGIISEISDDFIQIAENDEFNFNGEIIIRRDHFDAIRCNQFEKTIKKILMAENQLTKEKPQSTSIDITSWKTIFEGLMKIDIHVIIECEDLKNPTFSIGPIQKIHHKSVEILNYDAMGHFNKKSTRINYRDITILKFNDKYSTVFRKYLKNSKSKKIDATKIHHNLPIQS